MKLIPISEIFCSVQGEGPRAGMPAVFIRFWGCNLSCSFCDSKFSWDSTIEGPNGMTLEQVTAEVSKYATKNIIFTGGEPMQQQGAMRDICAALQPTFVEIETNGTIMSEVDDIIDQWNVSPKFDFPKPIQIETGDTVYWKFIIRSQNDLNKMDSFCAEHNITGEQIVIQPEGVTAKAICDKADWLTEEVIKRGARLSPRLHVLLWNDERAV